MKEPLFSKEQVEMLYKDLLGEYIDRTVKISYDQYSKRIICHTNSGHTIILTRDGVWRYTD